MTLNLTDIYDLAIALEGLEERCRKNYETAKCDAQREQYRSGAETWGRLRKKFETLADALDNPTTKTSTINVIR